MPNLMLTNYCNYRCSYCFGKDIMYPKTPRQTMTRECFDGIVEWVKKGPSDRIFHLMGGEPTLNPDYLIQALRQLQPGLTPDFAEFTRLEERTIPAELDYDRIIGLRLEAREKLKKIRPENLGRASRISGVSPADISVLMIAMESEK